MKLSELIDRNPEIFEDLPGRFDMGASPSVLDEVWYDVIIGREFSEASEGSNTFILRLKIYQVENGDIKARLELLDYVAEKGCRDRKLIPMRNVEDMRADIKAEAFLWNFDPRYLDTADPTLGAVETIQLNLSDQIMCAA